MFGVSETAIGILVIIYGILKVAMIYVSVALSHEDQNMVSQIPFIGSFVVKDATLAGKMVEYALLVFAVFSIIRGLVKVNLFNSDIVTSESTMYILYGIVGMLLIIFYSLVVYTDVKIEKDPANIEKYESVNLVHGITFVAMIPLFLIYNDVMDNMNSLNNVFSTTNLILSIWLLASVILIAVLTLKNNSKGKQNVGASDAITLAMIPTSTL